MRIYGLAAIGAVMLLGVPAQACAQAQDSTRTEDDWRERLDQEVLAAGEIYLQLEYEGVADGFMRFGWQVDGDVIDIYDRTMWASREVYETMEARVRLEDLAPVSSDIRYHQAGNYYVFDVDFESGAANGQMHVVRPGQPEASQPVAQELEQGAILRASYFVVAAALPLEVGDSVTFNWYAVMGGEGAAVTLTAVEEVGIDTPAGHFTTLRIEQRGGTPPNDIFIDRESGRIVRIDVGGQPMQFVAPAPG
ncbi:hypothetical protein [Maricaulis sp.]|uniref:DUF3108 domain-containing protein n=1 Tax=Maricaulis sp. TaxID=1486257 RepID=UPI0025C0B55C|nr:hypothetical protein [Maricaulis sp.]